MIQTAWWVSEKDIFGFVSREKLASWEQKGSTGSASQRRNACKENTLGL